VHERRDSIGRGALQPLDPRQQRRVVADRDDDRPVAVLGLGQQVLADASAEASAITTTSDGPRKPSIPTSPLTSRLASWTQRLPGPAMTSTRWMVSVP
jgi:hypothetical protein